MFSFDEYSGCYKASLKIVNLYDVLTDVVLDNESSLDEFMVFIGELKKAIDEEDKVYNELSVDDIKNFIEKLKEITSEEGTLFSDIRISNRLAFVNDILINNSFKNNGLFPTLDDNLELSLLDIINSKIVIDTYKLLNNKLVSLSLKDIKSLDYAQKIDTLNIEHIFYKLSLYVLSEKLAVKSMFNISMMPTIDLNKVENRIIEEKGFEINLYEIINSRLYDSIISLIDNFKNMLLDSSDYISIYDNLVYVTQFELFLSYLTKEQLEYISSYCDGIKSDNKLVLDNIKRLVKNKINGF